MKREDRRRGPLASTAAVSLEVRSISSGTTDLATWEPGRPEDVWLPLAVEIGVEGEPGADLFYVTVATVEAMRTHMPRHPDQRPLLLVVNEFHSHQVVDTVTHLVRNASGQVWHDAVEQLQRHFQYEYEDYRP